MTDIVDPFKSEQSDIVDPFRQSAPPAAAPSESPGFIGSLVRGFKRSLPECQTRMQMALKFASASAIESPQREVAMR